jgi:hypothetical protein
LYFCLFALLAKGFFNKLDESYPILSSTNVSCKNRS